MSNLSYRSLAVVGIVVLFLCILTGGLTLFWRAGFWDEGPEWSTGISPTPGFAVVADGTPVNAGNAARAFSEAGIPPLAIPSIPAIAVVPTSAPERGTEFGIQVDGWVPDDELEWSLDMIAEMGMRWVKYQVRWEMFMPEPFEMDWHHVAVLDRDIAAARRRGLNVLLSVTSTPEWARPAPNMLRPAYPGSYGHFVQWVAERYQGNIGAIELYNEPNIEMEFGWPVSPAVYAAMVEYSSQVRLMDSPPMLISAGLAPTEMTGWRVMPDLQFLQALRELGTLDLVDCVGGHYNHGTESPLVPGGQWEQMVHRYMEIAGAKPICLTEFGIAVPRGGRMYDGFAWAAENSLEEQATFLADMVRWTREHPGIVWLVIFWNWNYSYPGYPNEMYALADSRARVVTPAYYRLREVLNVVP